MAVKFIHLRLFISFCLFVMPCCLISQWTFLGNIDIGSGKIKEYNGNYYALNINGIYKSKDLSSPWEYLDGSNKFTGYFQILTSDFWVQDSSILVESMDDATTQYFYVSDNMGKSMKSFSTFEGIKNVDIRQSEDTLIIYSSNGVFMLSNGFQITEDTVRYFNIPLNHQNHIDPRKKCYLIRNHQILDVKPGVFNASTSKVLYDLPPGWEFQQMLKVEDKLFIWMNNHDSSNIFVYDPGNNNFFSAFTFPKTKYFPRFKIYNFCYLKYEKGVVFLVKKDNNTFKTYFTKDLGINWFSTIEMTKGVFDFIGEAIFFSGKDSIFYSIDDGQTFVPKVKGILHNFGYDEQDAVYHIQNDAYLQFDNKRTFRLDSTSKKFFEIKQYRNVHWKSTSDGELFGIYDLKFCHFNKTDSVWNCNFPINLTKRIYRIKIMNDVLFLMTQSEILFSLDGGISWSNLLHNIPTDIFFKNGYYYCRMENFIVRSKDLVDWQKFSLSDYVNFNISTVLSDGNKIYLYDKVNNHFLQLDESGGTFILKNPPLLQYEFKRGMISTDNGNIFAFGVNNYLYQYNPLHDEWELQSDFDQIKIFNMVVKGNDIYALNTKGLWKKSFQVVTSTQDEKKLPTGKELIIFPVPATDFINILVSDEIKIDVITIKDVTGREYSIVCSDRSVIQQIDLSFLANGVYFVNIVTTEGKTLTGKVIKN